MGYDSIKNLVGDYKIRKTNIDIEDDVLSQDEHVLDSMKPDLIKLDDDLQQKIAQVTDEFTGERNRIDMTKDELLSEKESLSDDITSEMGKLSDAYERLSRAEKTRYGKGVDSARRKSREYHSELDDLLGQLDEDFEGGLGLGLSDRAGLADYGGDNRSQDSISDRVDISGSEDRVNVRGDGYDSENAPNDNSFGVNNSVYGNGCFTPLPKTNQTVEPMYIDGHIVDVFDHPFDPNNYRICNQGSAYPSGPTETCGCCSCGTIINKAGGHTNEHDIVEHAWNNKLCTSTGGTWPSGWSRILSDAGINSTDTSGTSLPDLAKKVEEGHGVVIGVCAELYHPAWYGSYSPFSAHGHALVLESVIRDRATGNILEYVVSDSNAKDRNSACIKVKAKVLERAYKNQRSCSVVTDDIIW